MYVSEKYKFVYMAPQKTASTSIASVLVSEFDAFIYTNWEHQPARPEILLSPNGYLKHLNCLPNEFADYFVFASIRNPYCRMSSMYEENKKYNQANKLVDLPSFKNYLVERLTCRIRHPHSMYGQLNLGCDPPKGCVKFEISALVRMENLNEDFNKLPFVNTPVTLPHLNKSSFNKYSQEMANLVFTHQRNDFEKFGYSKTPPRKIIFKEFL